jgi:hypothetical protein
MMRPSVSSPWPAQYMKTLSVGPDLRQGDSLPSHVMAETMLAAVTLASRKSIFRFWYTLCPAFLPVATLNSFPFGLGFRTAGAV